MGDHAGCGWMAIMEDFGYWISGFFRPMNLWEVRKIYEHANKDTSSSSVEEKNDEKITQKILHKS